MAAFSSSSAMMAGMEVSASAAMSCLVQSVGSLGSPSTETSIVNACPPWAAITDAM
jgi:hypothetical protein